MDTLAIQYTTLNVRSSSFTTGSLAVANADTDHALIIDRTVPNGLNFQDSSVEMTLSAQLSVDNGLTWQEFAGASTVGGIIFDHHTNEWFVVTSLEGSIPAGAGRLLRAVVTTPTSLPAAFPLAFTGMMLADSAPITIAP